MTGFSRRGGSVAFDTVNGVLYRVWFPAWHILFTASSVRSEADLDKVCLRTSEGRPYILWRRTSKEYCFKSA